MINKYYVRKLKKLLEKNTRYETIRMWDEPTPYILTNKEDYYKITKYIDKLLGEKNEKRRIIK